MTITFHLRDPEETQFVADLLKSVHFSERSTLARIEIEIAASRHLA